MYIYIALVVRKQEGVARIMSTEKHLKSMEVIMTSPKSLKRRTLMRRLHVGMRRQEDMFAVCEWGCGDWVRAGHDQIDHQMKRCTFVMYYYVSFYDRD